MIPDSAIEDVANASLSLQYEAQEFADTYMASASALALYEVSRARHRSRSARPTR